MRIALVALSCQNGGMLHYTTQLSKSLGQVAEVHLLTPDSQGLSSALPSATRFAPLLPLSVPGQGKRNALRQLSLMRHLENARRIRAIKPDVVHLTTPHPSNALLLPLLGKAHTCLTLHDPTPHPGELSLLKDRLARSAAKAAGRVVIHGESLRSEAIALGIPPERLAVIPHGDYGFLCDLSPDLPEEDLILCFGRLIRYKGLEVLCRAERLLADRRGDYRLCIAGEGDASLFRSEIGPSGRVEVLDRFLSDGETSSLFKRARIVVLPYQQASQSGVLAIALAFGKPVIVTSVGALPEAVGFGEAGLIVPPDDEQALADAIERLWDDQDLRKRLGAAGRRRVEQHIGWPIVARQHLELYQRMQGRVTH